jgi:hypothetical protein
VSRPTAMSITCIRAAHRLRISRCTIGLAAPDAAALAMFAAARSAADVARFFRARPRS